MSNKEIQILLRILFWDPLRPRENWAQTLVRVGGNLIRSTITVSAIALGIAFLVHYTSQ